MDNRLYFLHIAKTGGTTFRHILDSYFPHQSIFPGYTLDQVLSSSDLSPFRLFRLHAGHQAVNKLPQPIDVVTLLRDPAAVAVSAYKHQKRHPDATWHGAIHGDGMSLYDFLVDHRTYRILKNPFVYSLAGRHDALDLALKRLESLAFIGVLEELEKSVTVLCHRYRWRLPAYLPKLNVSEPADPNDGRIIEAIERLTNLDRVLYERAVELLGARYDSTIRDLLDTRAICAPSVLAADIGPYDHVNWFGWYPPENGVRWSGPSTVSTVDIPLARHDFTLRVILAAAISEKVMESAQVTLNSHELSVRWDEKTLVADIPAEAVCSRLSRLRFQVCETVSPSKVNPRNGDVRELGFAVKRITIRPR